MLNLTGRASSGEEGQGSRKTWTDILVDSAIVGGVAVFATIGSMPPTWETAWVAFKAFGAAFFIQLVAERGLKRARIEE